MSDFLLQLSGNARARQLVKSLGLPLPMPQVLRRARGPYEERPLRDRTLLIGGGLIGELAESLARSVIEAGADVVIEGGTGAFEAPAEAWGRPLRAADDLTEGERVDGMLYDASHVRDVLGLRGLYEFFHPHVRRLAPCSSVVIVTRPPDEAQAVEVGAVRQAVEGFVRSLAKEVGRRGSTVQLLRVESGAENRLDGPLRFFLSDRSAYVTGQPLRISRAAGGTAQSTRTRVLDGKIALVTGAARGIGAATVELLAAEGAKVVCLDRPDDDELASRIAQKNDGVVLLQDVTEPGANKSIADALNVLGGVDIVVHNAGVTRDKTLAKMTDAQWDLAIDVNLTAIIRITRELVWREVLRDGGRVICLSSVAGLAGNMGQTNYAASKAGVVGYVRAMALELADRSITVNAIAPGFIETRLTDAMPAMIREVARRLSALGQGGRPEDVGQAITFLASPGAAGVTGEVLRICGGAFVGS